MNPNTWQIDQARRTEMERAAHKRRQTAQARPRRAFQKAIGMWMVETGQRMQQDEPTMRRHTVAQ